MDPSSPRPELSDRLEALLEAARAGSADALGELLEQARSYLLCVANAKRNALLHAKASGSDLVQDTFLQAQCIFDRFRGNSREELLAWLRAILLNKLAMFNRQFLATDKRRVEREVSLDAASTPARGHAWDTPTPSNLAEQGEQAEAVRRAIDRLPEQYRQVIVWAQWEQLSFAEIGQRLGRSADAARMLWSRALDRLEQQLLGFV